jgi:acyl-coenzyme A synthetase/AMP-(fatty) acid ligase
MSASLLAPFADGPGCAAEIVFARADSVANITRQQLMDSVQCLAQELRGHGRHCINLCDDRYHFTLSFSAALLAGMTNLLPANRQPETVLQVAAGHPGCVLVYDSALEPGLLDKLQSQETPLWDLASYIPQLSNRLSGPPEIAANYHTATVFTSGSTGHPTGITKTWGTLSGTTGLLCDRFLTADSRASIVATVPPQHMYGLEMTVMMALQGNCCIHSGRPFFPVDIVRALADMPAPRILVTTPIHMKALLQSKLSLPELHSVISATAPLSTELARKAEISWKCPIREIYGCSEAGSLASRRTSKGDIWRTLDGVMLESIDGEPVIRAPHLSDPVVLQDSLEIIAPEQFRLLGRSADMLNIGGKRASLQQLTAQLLAVEGVADGIVFLPNEGKQQGRTGRLAALVVSERPQQAISRDLLQQIDPVFLPRPLRIVNALPRNAVGKCTRQALIQALQTTEPGDRGGK